MIKAYFTLVLSFFAAGLVWSQEENAIEVVNETVRFEKVVSVPGKNSTTISDTLKRFLEKKSADNFTLHEKEESTFTGTGIVRNTAFYGKKFSQLNFDYTIMIKDERFKIVLERFLIGDLMNKTESINGYLVKSNGKLNSGIKAGKYTEELNKTIQGILAEMKNAFETGLDASGGADDW